MVQRRTTLKAALVAAALIGAGALGLASPADARVWVDVGVGVPYAYPYPYYYPYAPYYYPPPVVYAAPPVYVAPPAALAPAPQNWYYCNNPQGYYPTVQSCPGGWQEVPAQPPQR